MTKKRIDIPRNSRDKILSEFNHRCAICGESNPHVHHIDDDPSNNDLLNLLPLCPNCHQIDQHNPTSTIDPNKLKLFRRYKDPTILSPEFEPLFQRLQFLDIAGDSSVSYQTLADDASELVAFVDKLEMGSFYAKKVEGFVKAPPGILVYLSEKSERKSQDQIGTKDLEYRDKLSSVQTEVYNLIVEMLRYQKWARHSIVKK